MSYNDLNELSNSKLQKLIEATGMKSSTNYNRNRKILSEYLKENNYKGSIKYKSINSFIQESNFPLMNTEAGYKKKSVDRSIRKEMYEMTNVNAGYMNKSKTKEQKEESFSKIKNAVDMIKKAKGVIKSIDDKPLAGEKWLKKDDNNPKKDVKYGNRVIEFNIEKMNDTERDYFNTHIGKVFIDLLKKVHMNSSQKWLVIYDMSGKLEGTTLNVRNIGCLLHQLKNENFISDVEAEASGIIELHYDFFLDEIKNLNSIRLFDLTAYPNLTVEDLKKGEIKHRTEEDIRKRTKLTKDEKEMLDNLKAMNNEKLIETFWNMKLGKKKTYKNREGDFWKYLCTLPINLERYQIFNELNKRTAELMNRDNCFVYACIQAGVDERTIEFMREIIKSRSLPQSKIQAIANETEIEFKVYLPESERHTITYTPKDENEKPKTPKMTINLILMDEHYMLNERVPISTYFIKNYKNIVKKCSTWSLEKMQLVTRLREGRYVIDSKHTTKLCTVIKTLFQEGYFEPISYGDMFTYTTTLYKQNLAEMTDLKYNPKFCCRVKEEYVPKEGKRKNKVDIKPEHFYFADFECSTDGVHKAFNICFDNEKGTNPRSIWGKDCAIEFLEALEDKSLVYFHNLSYDINFILRHLDKITGTPIIKGSRTMLIQGEYNDKRLFFKDSYTVISKPLKDFPECFKLKTGAKEVFPYRYYTSEILKNSNRIGDINEALKYVEDKETFINNINNIKGCRISESKFDLEKYSTYYCSQDVRILREGFMKFRDDLYKEFNLNVFDYVSICSVSNKLFENRVYYPNGNLFDLANKPREFISRCIHGGRCMLCNNQKQINMSQDLISDFDAVSLYPSAIARLYTLEGIPKVMKNEMLNVEYLIKHLFDEEQVEPSSDKFISGFFAEIEITSIGINREFPLIVVDPELNPKLDVPRSSNTCCRMMVDQISLLDLIKYQGIKCNIIKGYYYDGKRDYRIRDEIKKLFELRLRYKKEENPLQEIIKLILNSIYGKTILAPIETKINFINDIDAMRYINKNYNEIIKFEELDGSDKIIFKTQKSICRHFNFCHMGVNILSMSKRIMNEVICTAEDLGIKVFYVDTDSVHVFDKEIPRLAEEFKNRYGRELIGKNLGQFHSDFAEITKDHQSFAYKSIFCGKKTYIDLLINDLNEVAFHCRMKGVKQDVIAITANEMFPDAVPVKFDDKLNLHVPVGKHDKNSDFSIMKLYKALYDGDEIAFDLCRSSKPCFDRKFDFTVETKNKFIRKLKFE